MMPTYYISLPEALWRRIREKNVIPEGQMRTVFDGATTRTRGTGRSRFVTGRHSEITDILLQLRTLTEEIQRRERTAKEFGTSLQELKRHSSQRPKFMED